MSANAELGSSESLSVAISYDVIQKLWNTLDSSGSLPGVTAVRMPKKKLIKALQEILDELPRFKDIINNLEDFIDDNKGFTMLGHDSNYYIFVLEGLSEAEEEQFLVHELANVSWRDWNTHVSESNCKWYVR
jgi:hypothetical protein